MFDKICINKSKIKAIIFDFDGVILDSVNLKTDAFRELFANYSIDIQNKIINHHIQNGGMSRYEKIEFYFKEFIKEDLTSQKFKKYLNRFQNILFAKIENCNFIDGIIEFLDQNSHKFEFYIVSATPQEELENIIKRKHIFHYFKQIYGSPQKKEINLSKLLKENNLSKDEVFYIGDSLNDYEACKKNNILFIGI